MASQSAQIDAPMAKKPRPHLANIFLQIGLSLSCCAFFVPWIAFKEIPEEAALIERGAYSVGEIIDISEKIFGPEARVRFPTVNGTWEVAKVNLMHVDEAYAAPGKAFIVIYLPDRPTVLRSASFSYERTKAVLTGMIWAMCSGFLLVVFAIRLLNRTSEIPPPDPTVMT